MDVKEAILARRSIRKYKPDPVSEEMVTELLEAARWAPSVSRSEPSSPPEGALGRDHLQSCRMM